jgi:AcrR family transcriptional regulator
VYSNFESKDALFLAVIDERSEERVREYRDVILDSKSFDEGVRLAAQVAWKTTRETPQWIPVLTEFWIHVAGRDGVRGAAFRRHHGTMDTLAELIEELGKRHGMEYSIPARDVARASSALVRGIELERLLDSEAEEAELFEELWVAQLKGLARPARRRARRKE